MITISENRDARLIASLNADVQNLHAALHPTLFKPHEQAAMETALQSFLADPNCRVYVAHQDGEAIGYAIYLIRELPDNAFHYALRSLYLDQLSVLPAHRKSGVAAALLKAGERLAAELGISRLELDHWSANVVAAAYFRKQGYQLCKERMYKLV